MKLETINSGFEKGKNPIAEKFSYDALKGFRKRFYHAITGQDVLNLGVLCYKHMNDQIPPTIKWKGFSFCYRNATEDKKAGYRQYKALHYIECYGEDKKKFQRYGIEYALEDIMLNEL